MCLLWHRESYGFLHTICLHQKNKKLPSFLWHMLSCVFWQEKTCFAVQNPQLWKVRLCPFCLCMHLWVCVCPSRPPPMPPDRRPRGWSTGKPTLKFNSDLKIVWVDVIEILHSTRYVIPLSTICYTILKVVWGCASSSFIIFWHECMIVSILNWRKNNGLKNGNNWKF